MGIAMNLKSGAEQDLTSPSGIPIPTTTIRSNTPILISVMSITATPIDAQGWLPFGLHHDRRHRKPDQTERDKQKNNEAG